MSIHISPLRLKREGTYRTSIGSIQARLPVSQEILRANVDCLALRFNFITVGLISRRDFTLNFTRNSTISQLPTLKPTVPTLPEVGLSM